MRCEQMTLIDVVDDYKKIQSLVVKELRLYRALKVRIENDEENNKHGIDNLFPALRKANNENAIKVGQMDRALEHSLDIEERQLIEMKYLSGEREKDITVYTDLMMDKDRYYATKQNAIRYLATALGII